jgi:hypothetical protein
LRTRPVYVSCITGILPAGPDIRVRQISSYFSLLPAAELLQDFLVQRREAFLNEFFRHARPSVNWSLCSHTLVAALVLRVLHGAAGKNFGAGWKLVYSVMLMGKDTKTMPSPGNIRRTGSGNGCNGRITRCTGLLE